ncbi:hypothetical protein EMCRGX_G016287 [Ephydatia muelleri]
MVLVRLCILDLTQRLPDLGMFVGTVEMGGEKYIGTPAPTKPEAQQVVASMANASLPPVDRKQAKKSSPAVISNNASGTGTVTSKEDIVRRNLLESLNSVATETISSSESPSAVAASSKQAPPPPMPPTLPSSSSQDGNCQTSRLNMESTSLPRDTTALLHQLDKASRHQEETARRLQELVQMQLEGSSSIGNNEGGGVVGAQAVPQDPLLSLLTDLDDDVIGYQEAVPSTDGADGEVVVVGEIIGQDALHLSRAQDVTLETEGMATGTQEAKQVVSSWTKEVAGSDKPAEEGATPSGLVLWKLVSAVLAVKVDKESYTAENIAALLKDCANEHSVAITVIEDDHTPNLDDLMNDVAVISAKWRLVGVQLKLPNGTLDEIQAQNAGRPDVC